MELGSKMDLPTGNLWRQRESSKLRGLMGAYTWLLIALGSYWGVSSGPL